MLSMRKVRSNSRGIEVHPATHRLSRYSRLALLVSSFCCGGALQAQTTYTWNVTSGGDWGTASNWSPSSSFPGNVSGVFDAVNFGGDPTAGYAINISTGTISSGIVYLNSLNFTQTDTASGNSYTISGGTISLGGATPTVNIATQGVTATISSILGGGSLTLTKTGAGTLVLSGANTYTGATTISAGIVNYQNGAALGVSSAITVASGATVQVQGGITGGALPLKISGTGAANATGALESVSGSNSYAGPLTLGANSTISVDTGSVLSLTNTGLIGGATFSLTLAGGGNGSIASIIGTTTGALNMTGTGVFTLTGANTYSGGTTINSGTLQVGSGGATGSLGTGAVVDNGALVYKLSSFTLNTPITGAGTVSNTGATGALTISASIGLTNNNFTFASVGGTLSSGVNLSVGTGVGSITSATTSGSGFTMSGTNSLSASGGGSITISGSTTTTGGGNNGLILGGAKLTTSGTVNLKGQNTGEWAIGFGSSATISATSGITTLTGTTTNNSSSKSPFEFIYASSSSLTLTAASGASIVLTGGTATGTGTAIFNDYTGGTVYNVTGNVSFVAGATSSTDSFWGHQGTLNAGTPKFNVGANSSLTLNAGVTSMTDGLTVVSMGATSSVTVAGSGTGTMSGAMALTNSTDSLIYTISGALTQSGAISGAGSVIANGAGALTVSGIISGSNSVSMNGAGTLTLSAANTYTGATTVSAGTLVLTSTSTTSVLNVTGGTLLVNSIVTTPNVSVSGGGTLGGTGSVGSTTVAANGIIQAGANGTGQLTLASLTFSGAGSVDFGALSNYSSSTGIVVSGSGLLNPGSSNNSIQINVSSLAGTTVGNTYELIGYSGSIAGAGFAAFQLGALPNRQTGVLVNNPHEIDLMITGGSFSLIWTGAGNLSNGWDTATQNWKLNPGGAPTTYINNPGDSVIFDDSASPSSTTVSLALNVLPSSVTFNNSVNNYTLQGSFGIGGSTGLMKTGTGMLTILTANTYTGVTTLNGGTVNLGVAQTGSTSGPLGASGSIVFGGGTLQYSTNNQFDYSSRFSTAASQAYSVDTNGQKVTWAAALTSAGGTLFKTGAGTLTLTGANTYAGGTTINAGTLQAGAGGAAGSPGTGAIVDNGALVYNLTSLTIGAPISGTGTVSNLGATGALTISANISLTNNNFTLTSTGATPTVVALGSLSSGANLSVGTGVGVITVTNTNTAVGGYTGFAIAGTNSLSATGAGSITITGIANTTGGGANGLNLSGSVLTTSGTINLVGQNAGEWGLWVRKQREH